MSRKRLFLFWTAIWLPSIVIGIIGLLFHDIPENIFIRISVILVFSIGLFFSLFAVIKLRAMLKQQSYSIRIFENKQKTPYLPLFILVAYLLCVLTGSILWLSEGKTGLPGFTFSPFIFYKIVSGSFGIVFGIFFISLFPYISLIKE